MRDDRWQPLVRQALALAAEAADGPDVPVAALVVDDAGAVWGSAVNRREASGDPTAHAEVLALRQAAAALGTWRLTGLTLVATLEPCPMCAGAAWLARVDRVVFGTWNHEYGAAGSLWDVLRDGRLNHRPEVVAGVLAEECSSQLSDWFGRQRARTD